MSPTRTARKISLGLAAGLILIVLARVATYQAVRRHVEALTWVTHTVEVRQRIAEMVLAVGEPGGQDRARQLVDELRDLTADNPRQQARIFALAAAFSQGAPDTVRVLARAIDAEEHQLLDARRRAAADAERRARWSIWGAAVMSILLVAACAIGLHRQARLAAETTQRLRAGEQKFRLLADHATDLVILQDKQGNARYVSPSCHRLLGFSPEEMLRDNVLSFVHDDDRNSVMRFADDIMDSRDPSAAVRFRFRTKQGRYKWFESRTYIVENQESGGVLFQTTARDVNDQVLVEQGLAKSREVYRTLVRNLPNMSVAIYDNQMRYQLVDGPLIEKLGMTKAEIEGKLVAEVTRPEHRGMADEMYRAALRGRVVEMENMSGDRVFNVVLSPLTVDGFEPMGVAVTRDVTDERRLEDLLAKQAEELRSLSLRDELTGLNNRRGFVTLATQQMKVATRQRKPVALLFIDLNGMKPINDTLGHQAGDDALKDTAAILRGTFRESDIMARLGGDEFAVLANDLGPDDVRFVLARLDASVERHNQTAQRPYKVSISVGVVHHEPGMAGSIEDLLAEADRRMYEDKRARKLERGAGPALSLVSARA